MTQGFRFGTPDDDDLVGLLPLAAEERVLPQHAELQHRNTPTTATPQPSSTATPQHRNTEQRSTPIQTHLLSPVRQNSSP
ncbi:hypothetical protein ACWCXK_02285 [Streptomyces sp. NPDC001739]